MTAKIQVRRDTTAQWAAATPPTLDVGEIGLDTDLKQIKIGDNVNNWTALPWLGGTLPFFSSPAADIDAATNRVAGLYRWAGIASITSGVVPAAPIDIKTADGGINMLVLKFNSTVMQHLWTDGDGTVTPKSYTRVWDGDVSLWRAWVPQNIWGISATEGVDVVAKSITLKDTGTGLTVDGNSTLTGNVTVNGTTTLGNANADIVTVQAGTVSAPIITTSGDTDTGIYFPAANQVAVTAAGVQQLLLNSGAADVLSAVFRKGATFNERVDMNAFRVIDVGDAVQLTDAINWQTLLANIAIVVTASNGAVTASNGTTWNVTNIGSQVTFTPVAGGTYDGMVLSFAGGGTLQSAFSKHFNNTATPQSNAGSTGMAVMVAIRRS
jgi:hypothetical protein